MARRNVHSDFKCCVHVGRCVITPSFLGYDMCEDNYFIWNPRFVHVLRHRDGEINSLLNVCNRNGMYAKSEPRTIEHYFTNTESADSLTLYSYESTLMRYPRVFILKFWKMNLEFDLAFLTKSPLIFMTFLNVIVFHCYPPYLDTLLVRYTEVYTWPLNLTNRWVKLTKNRESNLYWPCQQNTLGRVTFSNIHATTLCND